jgi:predicted TIM-barrel fold metal-dependent hydrolase
MIDARRVIDMQHHYIPPQALRLAGKTSEYDYSTSIKRFARAYRLMTDIEADLAFMDAAGIDLAILSTGSFTPNGLEFCRACNTGYGEVLRRYPGRFRGMAHVYPRDDPRRNADEIRRAVEELGLFGLALMSSYGEVTLDAPVMDPIYEAALAYDMPVFVHPTIRTALWGGDRYDMHTTVSREYDIAKSFVEILYGVLGRFPGLKVIVAHLGGGLPTLKGRLLAWHQPPHIAIPPESRGHGRSIEEAKALGMYQDLEARMANCLFDSAGYGGWLPAIKAGLETLGAGHVCFGSDYPYELNEPEATARVLAQVGELPFSEAEKTSYFSGNVARFFKL